MDKGEVVRAAATAAVKAILKACPPESTRTVFQAIEPFLKSGKWRSKAGALDTLKLFVAHAPSQVAAQLGTILPKVEEAMHDTKSEVITYFIICHWLEFNCVTGFFCGQQGSNEFVYHTRESRHHPTYSIACEMHG